MLVFPGSYTKSKKKKIIKKSCPITYAKQWEQICH